jgi:hypothetical protein
MAVWPAGLPQYVEQDGFSEKPANLGITFRTDSGATLSRQLHTAGSDSFTFKMFLTTAQTATLRTFYKDTVAGEALSWTWLHPITGAAATFYFVGALNFRAVGGTNFHATFAAEIRP